MIIRNSNACPFGPDYQVYWDMRHYLLRQFDQAQVDATGLYTMVPEAPALDMARRASGSRSLDLCSGIGAMSLALARAGQWVTAIELDARRVGMARHNAQLYGVAERIDFRVADATQLPAATLPTDIHTVFLDPPWGRSPGDYQKRSSTRLEDLMLAGLDLRDLLSRLPGAEVMMRLPPNFDIRIFLGVPAEKLAYVNRTGVLHWYFIRMSRASFIALGEQDAAADSEAAQREFKVILLPTT